jgi:hypothetical protein
MEDSDGSCRRIAHCIPFGLRDYCRSNDKRYVAFGAWRR